MIPAGWYVEGPDPSVGIFGTWIVHDECPSWDEDDPEAIVSESPGRHEGKGLSRRIVWHYRWTCPGCGASVMVQEMEWDPDESEAA